MIRSFADRATEALYYGKRVRAFEAFRAAAGRKLAMLESASELTDLKVPPGNCLEALHGKREGQHSIRINQPVATVFPLAGRACPRGRDR